MLLLSQCSLIETFNSVLKRKRSSLKKVRKTRRSASHIFRGRSPSGSLGLPSPKGVLQGLRSSIPSHPDVWSIALHEEITEANY